MVKYCSLHSMIITYHLQICLEMWALSAFASVRGEMFVYIQAVYTHTRTRQYLSEVTSPLKLWPGIWNSFYLLYFPFNVTSLCWHLLVLVLQSVLRSIALLRPTASWLISKWHQNISVKKKKSFVCKSCDQLLSTWHGKSLVLQCI